ncbi:MAG: NPCBM/NEW2 domain-containing protein [Phycisphaerales bacterium]|nr:MAG: NPCBM/NEW2 domain-containing protein [Phycisphaerales bacterium]
MKSSLRAARLFFILCATSSFVAVYPATTGAGEKVWLSDLDISKTMQGWGRARKDQSVDGNPLRIAGKTFEKGLGTHADSRLYVKLDGGSRRFSALVGIDDEAGRFGSVEFRVLADGEEVYKSGTIRSGQAARPVDVEVTGVDMLVLIVDAGPDGMNFDHADWANAAFEVVGARPLTVDAPREEAVILTPKPGPKPRINSARIFGVRPGSPVLYTIAATGQRPLGFNAENLPEGSRSAMRRDGLPDASRNAGSMRSRWKPETTWAGTAAR